MNDAGLAGTPERSRLTAGALLFIAILGIAAGLTRFWALGARPLHHDESIHAYQSWTLSRGGDWRYDPAYHGPFLYYVNALVYKVFGATNFTARLMPAVFGLILIAFAWPLRRWIGKPAAAVYAVLVLISPHFAYFSRFIREDLYSLVFTLATILAFQRFLETDRSKWLTLAAASFALAGVTKENAYMTGVLFVAYGLWCLVRGVGEPQGPTARRAAIAPAARWTCATLVPIFSAGHLFLVIWATMYTAFGKYPGDWLAIPKAVKYWMGQHAIARIPGPWYYYFPQLRTTRRRSCSPRASRSRGRSGAAIRSCGPSCCSPRSRWPRESTRRGGPSRPCCPPGARCCWRSRPRWSRSLPGRIPNRPRRRSSCASSRSGPSGRSRSTAGRARRCPG